MKMSGELITWRWDIFPKLPKIVTKNEKIIESIQ